MPVQQRVRDLARRASRPRWQLPAEFRGLAGIVTALVLAASAWTFIEISEDVAEGDTARFDTWVLELLRQGDIASQQARPVGPDWLVTAALDLTSLGSVAVLVLVVAMTAAFLALKRHFHAMLLVLVCTGLGLVLNLSLKAAFDRERPQSHLHVVDVSTASFPSGHAMMSAVTYLTLGALLASVGKPTRIKIFAGTAAVVVTVLVGLTRLYLGVHHATDVLAGWAAGLTWALACWLVAQWLQRRGVLSQTAASAQMRGFAAPRRQG
jgi:undecaprenyl-diphosphatase